jgi:hypothetical protein
MPKKDDVFGVYDAEYKFRPYAAYAGRANDFDGLDTWRVRPLRALDSRPLRSGDLIFYHATRQLTLLDQHEIESKSEAGEFLPGFYTTSGTDLTGSIQLGWYWYECPKKTDKPKKDWNVLAFVLRREHVETYLAGPFVRETCNYYLQTPRAFSRGGAAPSAEDLRALEFANRNGQVMIFPDKTTKITCGRGATPYSLDQFVLERKGLDSLAEYAVIVGLQKPPPLTMRQQCWVTPNGLWHINHAERYLAFSRERDGLAAITDFVVANR